MTINLNRFTKPIVALGMGLTLVWTGASVFAEPPQIQSKDQGAVGEPEESLEVRYARAHLELAQLDLKRAEYWNRRIPDLISARTIDFLKKHVEVDAEQLRQSQQENYADVSQIYLSGAKAALELAEADVARKQATFSSNGGTASALELDRALAVANVARLNLERTMSQNDSSQSISYLQWQLEELRNQILELQIKVESTPER